MNVILMGIKEVGCAMMRNMQNLQNNRRMSDK
jgi:hypothetical protein